MLSVAMTACDELLRHACDEPPVAREHCTMREAPTVCDDGGALHVQHPLVSCRVAVEPDAVIEARGLQLVVADGAMLLQPGMNESHVRRETDRRLMQGATAMERRTRSKPYRARFTVAARSKRRQIEGTNVQHILEKITTCRFAALCGALCAGVALVFEVFGRGNVGHRDLMLRTIVPVVMRAVGGEQESFPLSDLDTPGRKTAAIPRTLDGELESHVFVSRADKESVERVQTTRLDAGRGDCLTNQKAAKEARFVRFRRSGRSPPAGACGCQRKEVIEVHRAAERRALKDLKEPRAAHAASHAHRNDTEARVAPPSFM